MDHRPTPLSWAASLGDVQCVELLLEAGADVNYVHSKGSTALYESWVNLCDDNTQKIEAVVKLLLGAGANVNMIDTHDNTIDHATGGNICLLMFAAGELNPIRSKHVMRFDFESISLGDYPSDEQCGNNLPGAKDPESVELDQFFPPCWDDLDLKNQCRKVIRKHLLTLDPHTNLFIRVPQLQGIIPRRLISYLLYEQNLELPIQ